MASYLFDAQTFELKIKKPKSGAATVTKSNNRTGSKSKDLLDLSKVESQDSDQEVAGRVQADLLPLIQSGVCIIENHAKIKQANQKGLNILKVFIFDPLKQLFETELKNLAWLKVSSRLVSGEPSFSRKKLFKLLDFEIQQTVSVDNFKQFCAKHNKPLSFQKLKLLFRRFKVDLQQRISPKEFNLIFFDIYNKGAEHERHSYNIYYQRPEVSQERQHAIIGEGRRQMLRTIQSDSFYPTYHGII